MWVADTKYKLLDEQGTIPNPDAYQLVTYCLRLRLTDGHLIYAGASSDTEHRYGIIGLASLFTSTRSILMPIYRT